MKCPNCCYIDNIVCNICNNTGKVNIFIWIREKISILLFKRKLKIWNKQIEKSNKEYKLFKKTFKHQLNDSLIPMSEESYKITIYKKNHKDIL